MCWRRRNTWCAQPCVRPTRRAAAIAYAGAGGTGRQQRWLSGHCACSISREAACSPLAQCRPQQNTHCADNACCAAHAAPPFACVAAAATMSRCASTVLQEIQCGTASSLCTDAPPAAAIAPATAGACPATPAASPTAACCCCVSWTMSPGRTGVKQEKAAAGAASCCVP